VLEAVAPVYPPFAIAASQEGVVSANVTIGKKGNVTATMISGGSEILKKVADIAARKWVFASGHSTRRSRTVRLTFVFAIMSSDVPSDVLLPIFRPPYQIEIRAKRPSIDN
jgi:outer membrane biosynthesis protein TonB